MNIKYTVSAEILEQKYIFLRTEIESSIMNKIIDTEDAMIKEQLIKLGWTPPGHDKPK